MNIEELPYYNDLLAIRRFFEETQNNFPHQCCNTASNLVARETGLLELAGNFFIGDYEGPHAWNFDPLRGLYVDITQDQFPGVTAPIIITKPYTSRLQPLIEHMIIELECRPREIEDTEKMQARYREYQLRVA